MVEFNSHLLLAMLWLAWCAVHSLLISTRLRGIISRFLGKRDAYFRFAYILFSVVSFAAVVYFERGLPSIVYFDWPFPVSMLRYALLISALLIVYLGARQYDQAFFFGLKQIRNHLKDRSREFSSFSTHGILRRMRHPYYTGGMLFLIAWGDVTSVSLVSKSILIGYLIVGAFIEEKKLAAEFGEVYREYQRKVPMFIPSLGKKLPEDP